MSIQDPSSAGAGRILTRSLWIALAAVLAITMASGARALMQSGGGPAAGAGSYLSNLGDYGVVPAFDLKDVSGRAVTLRDLAGKYWVADFIFTRCTGMCPTLTARMASLNQAMHQTMHQAMSGTGPRAGSDGGAAPGSDVLFVSFSVDPDWDTPSVLGRYADAHGAEPGRWLFLTGSRGDLHRLIGEGFHLNVAEAPPDAASSGDLITHSDRFVLVDPAARIRGYYHGTDEASMRRLWEDLERLRRETAR